MPDNPLKQAILGGTFSFTPRPEPIAGDLRMSWGLAILLLSLLKSRGTKASFQKLQFLAHSVRISEGREDVRALFNGSIRSSEISVRVEPWLNRAVAFAHALRLVSITKGKSVGLTDAGKAIASSIDADRNLLADEKAFLSEFAPKISEQILTKIWRMEEFS